MNVPDIYKKLYRIRRTEEKIIELYPTNTLTTPVHLCIGQEAIAVGVCEALEATDSLFSSYRGHGHYLARGGDLKALWSEFMGKVTGCCRGKGGSMHIIDPKVNFMGTSAIVASTIPQAVGYAYALKLQKKPGIVVSFFGDGAIDEGVFWESLNFACLKNLPILFVLENNGYAVHTSRSERQAGNLQDIKDKVLAFGISQYTKWVPILGIQNLIEKTQRARTFIQQQTQPFFLHAVTYRYREHVGVGEDWALGYRHPQDMKTFKDSDPLETLPALLDPVVRQQIHDEVNQELEEAVAFAQASPFPDRAELLTDILAGPSW